MIAVLATAAMAAAAAPAAVQAPGTVLTRVAAPTHVAARDGVVVFGAFDPATRATTLLRRRADGTIAPVGVPPVPLPAFTGDRRGGPSGPPSFEVTLGDGPRGRLTAAYLRCPAAARSSCRLALADLATGTERLVPGTGRVLRGAAWGSRVVLVRRDLDGVQRLYATRTSGGRLVRLRFPRLRAPRPFPSEPPPPPIDRKGVRIAAVDVRGDDVAYVVNYPVSPAGEIASSEVWLDRGRRAPRRVARVGTGGASSGFREFLQPRLERRSLVVFQQGRDQGSGLQRYAFSGRLLGAGALARRGFTSVEVTGGTYDRGRFWYAANPYQGNGCAAYDEPPGTGTCPVLDSGPVTLAAP